jgi:hypothetical protein
MFPSWHVDVFVTKTEHGFIREMSIRKVLHTFYTCQELEKVSPKVVAQRAIAIRDNIKAAGSTVVDDEPHLVLKYGSEEEILESIVKRDASRKELIMWIIDVQVAVAATEGALPLDRTSYGVGLPEGFRNVPK